jgi:hypothetical protein
MAAPAVPEPHATNQTYGVHVSVWGIDFTIPLPKPALYVLIVLLAIGVAGVALSKYYVVVQKAVWTNTSNDARAYAQLLPTTELAEFMKHFSETPQSSTPGPAGVQMAYYASDGCILVTRSSPGRPDTKHWVLDLSKVALPTPPKDGDAELAPHAVSAERGALLAELELPGREQIGSGQSLLRDHLELADLGTPRLMPVQAPAAHCMNPHRGQFQWWYGQVNGCFVQVWRKWPDGCTQFQWYNRCLNYFDPSINWTACFH